jgi:hypothetical protein
MKISAFSDVEMATLWLTRSIQWNACMDMGLTQLALLDVLKSYQSQEELLLVEILVKG